MAPMQTLVSIAVMILVLGGPTGLEIAVAQPVAVPLATAAEPFLLSPPQEEGPTVVRASFALHDLNEIDERNETFTFSGVLTLRWQDRRQAFDSSAAGVDEKVFQGGFQFSEIATCWYPQVVLVNEAGAYEKHGVVLRTRTDGSQTLIETITAVAKTEVDMRRFPLDTQRLAAVFEVLGFDDDEVVLRAEPESLGAAPRTARIPQWRITNVALASGIRAESYAGPRRVASTFVVNVDVKRLPFFVTRLVIIPLAVIVLISFSVFWMDRSLLADRLNVSFIGILTGVAYQIVVSDILPHISYFTLMHGFINLSFILMCLTVVVSVVVNRLDQRGRVADGDRVDRRCRWIFPLCYAGLVLLEVAVAFTFF